MAESGAIQERNKTSIRRFVEGALNRGDLQVVDATRGGFAEGGKGRIQVLRAAFPDLATTIHPIVAEGDWSLTEWSTPERTWDRSAGSRPPATESSSRQSR